MKVNKNFLPFVTRVKMYSMNIWINNIGDTIHLLCMCISSAKLQFWVLLDLFSPNLCHLIFWFYYMVFDLCNEQYTPW